MNLEQLTQVSTGAVDEPGVFTADLSGYAAHAAAKVLLENWTAALGDGTGDNLVQDVDDVIAQLRAFQNKVRLVLPLANGGFEGRSADEWLEKLDAIGVEVYEGEEDQDGYFGYTGCDADNYPSEAHAITAAVLANKDALGIA